VPKNVAEASQRPLTNTSRVRDRVGQYQLSLALTQSARRTDDQDGVLNRRGRLLDRRVSRAPSGRSLVTLQPDVACDVGSINGSI